MTVWSADTMGPGECFTLELRKNDATARFDSAFNEVQNNELNQALHE